MMNLIIKINLDGAVFDDWPERELEFVFGQALGRLDNALPLIEFQVSDSNGNQVGSVEITE